MVPVWMFGRGVPLNILLALLGGLANKALVLIFPHRFLVQAAVVHC